MTLGLGLSGVSELVRNGVIIAVLPPGQSDVFFAALSLPWIVVLLWTSLTRLAAVPLFARLAEGQEKARGRVFFAVALGWCSVAGLAAWATLSAAPDQLVAALAPGFTVEAQASAARVLRILAGLVLLVPFSGLAAAALNANGRYLVPAIERLVRNATVVAVALILGGLSTPVSLAYAMLAGAVVQALTLVPGLRRAGYLVRPALGGSPEVRTFLSAFGKMGLGYAAGQAVVLVDRAMASSIPGGIAIVAFAPQIVISTSALISSGVQTVLLPKMSRGGGNHPGDVLKSLADALQSALNLVLPATLALAAVSGPLFSALAGFGHFSSIDRDLAANMLAVYAVAVPATLVGQIISVVFYARNRVGVPTTQIALNAGLNIVLDVLLVWQFGLLGIAIAAAVTFAFNGIAMYARLRRLFAGNDWDTHGLRPDFGYLLQLAVLGGVAVSAVAVVRLGFTTLGPAGDGLTTAVALMSAGLSVLVLGAAWRMKGLDAIAGALVAVPLRLGKTFRKPVP